MSTEVIFPLFIKIFILIITGVVLKKTGILTDNLQKGISSLLLGVVLPASIIASANQPFDSNMGESLLIFTIISVMEFVLSFILAKAMGAVFKLSKEDRGIFPLLALLPNSAFLGFPLISALFGEKGMLYAVIFNIIWQVAAFTLGTASLSKSGKADLKELIKSPATVASLLAIFLYISPIRLPNVMVDTLNTVGSMCLPLSLFVVGGGLANIHIADIFSKKSAYMASFLRLIIMPGLIFIALFLIKANPLIIATATILSATPVGSLTVVMAEKYGAPKNVAVTAVVQSTALSLIFLPLWSGAIFALLPL